MLRISEIMFYFSIFFYQEKERKVHELEQKIKSAPAGKSQASTSSAAPPPSPHTESTHESTSTDVQGKDGFHTAPITPDTSVDHDVPPTYKASKDTQKPNVSSHPTQPAPSCPDLKDHHNLCLPVKPGSSMTTPGTMRVVAFVEQQARQVCNVNHLRHSFYVTFSI